jgi:hypothetical protein
MDAVNAACASLLECAGKHGDDGTFRCPSRRIDDGIYIA